MGQGVAVVDSGRCKDQEEEKEARAEPENKCGPKDDAVAAALVNKSTSEPRAEQQTQQRAAYISHGPELR
jgi:hypothetical protein